MSAIAQDSATTGRSRFDVDEPAKNQALRFLAIASYILAIVSNVRYKFGHRSPWDHGHQDDVGFTPFTASSIPVIMYWVLLIVAQFIYLSKYFNATPKILNWQFVFSNVHILLWSYFFARGYYILSEIFILLNFIQLLAGYILVGSYRIRPLDNWFAIHGSIIVMPMLWAHYLVFWNGAVLFGARNLPARLIANCVVWEFLLVPGCLMLMTGDCILGFASSWIAFAIGLGQLFTKVFALQWVFALTISVILLVGSFMLAFVKPMYDMTPPAESQLRVQPTNSNETAPLLNDF